MGNVRLEEIRLCEVRLAKNKVFANERIFYKLICVDFRILPNDSKVSFYLSKTNFKRKLLFVQITLCNELERYKNGKFR